MQIRFAPVHRLHAPATDWVRKAYYKNGTWNPADKKKRGKVRKRLGHNLDNRWDESMNRFSRACVRPDRPLRSFEGQ